MLQGKRPPFEYWSEHPQPHRQQQAQLSPDPQTITHVLVRRDVICKVCSVHMMKYSKALKRDPNLFALDINGSKNMVSLEWCTLAHLDNLCSSTAVPTCPPSPSASSNTTNSSPESITWLQWASYYGLICRSALPGRAYSSKLSVTEQHRRLILITTTQCTIPTSILAFAESFYLLTIYEWPSHCDKLKFADCKTLTLQNHKLIQCITRVSSGLIISTIF